MSYLVVSDLDGTLLGDLGALERFENWLSQRRSDLRLVYASGHDVSQILQKMHIKPLPAPDAIIGDVGGEIRLFPSLEPFGEWEEQTRKSWDSQKVRKTLDDEEDLELQPLKDQSPSKVSYVIPGASKARLEELTERLRSAGVEARCIYSSGRDLDIVPKGVDKGSAAAFLARQWGYMPHQVVVAGNTGNDAAMYEHGFRGIVVANAKDELTQLEDREVYRAQGSFADGVREGLEHVMGAKPITEGPAEERGRDLIAEGLHRALELFRECSVPEGFVAVPARHRNYRRIWGRDGSIMTLAALMSGEDDLVETGRKTLETLARYQGEQGQIPSNVDPGSNRISYGGTAGRVDADLWFVIACGQYWRRTGDDAFIERMCESLEKVRFLLRAWEFNARGLIYVPQTGDWADEYLHTGYVLYDQLLYLQAQRELAAIHGRVHGSEDHALKQKIARLVHLIETNYWFNGEGREEDIYHEVLYARVKEAAARKGGNYWTTYFSPSSFGYRFDALANVLVSLLGVATKDQSDEVDEFIEERARNEGFFLLPAFHPVITPRDEAWDDLQMMFSYSFKNEPYQYQNGGLWPMITGFYVADLAARGKKNAARRYLEGITTANAARMNGRCWSFPEYLHGRELTPGGQSRMGWSAAAALIGARALEGEAVLTREQPPS